MLTDGSYFSFQIETHLSVEWIQWWLNEWMPKEEEESDNTAVNHVQYRERGGRKGWTCHQYQSRPVFRWNGISNGFAGDQEMVWVCLCLVWENQICSVVISLDNVDSYRDNRACKDAIWTKDWVLSQVKANGKIIWMKKNRQKATIGDVFLWVMELPGMVIMYCHNKTKQFSSAQRCNWQTNGRKMLILK